MNGRRCQCDAFVCEGSTALTISCKGTSSRGLLPSCLVSGLPRSIWAVTALQDVGLDRTFGLISWGLTALPS